MEASRGPAAAPIAKNQKTYSIIVKAGGIMKQITIKVEMRVGEEMHKFLTDEAYRKKLSFEGLILSYVEERMQKEKAGMQRVSR